MIKLTTKGKVLLIFLIPLIPAFFASVFKPLNRLPDEAISYKALSHKSSSLIWIDARDSLKNDLPDKCQPSLHLSLDNYEQGLEDLLAIYTGEETLICVCHRSCDLSVQMAKRLRQDLGSVKVYYLYEGIEVLYD